MTSDLAMDDIEAIMSQGGRVSPRDVVRLNALALKITNDPKSSLAVLPRFYEHDTVVFREPTMKQNMLLDRIRNIYPGDGQMLQLMAYVLAHPDMEDRELDHPKIYRIKVLMWLAAKLPDITIEKLEQIVAFCVFGIGETDAEYKIYNSDSDDDTSLGHDESWALSQYLRTVASGIDSAAALRATSEQLTLMLERSFALTGKPLPDKVQTATADYYATLEEIKKKAFTGTENGRTED